MTPPIPPKVRYVLVLESIGRPRLESRIADLKIGKKNRSERCSSDDEGNKPQLSNEKKLYYFPLYWLFNRDSYNGI